MPESTRLLYILSDLAYVTKLTPGKKPHDFVLADFRQINGEFLDENTLLAANLEKLLAKLDPGSYKLILPDFLFTSTIVNLELADEAAVKTHLQDKLLPDLGINDTDYYLDTTVLSNYKGSFKVQLTALEKSVVAPLAAVLAKHTQVQIESMSPLSWSTKSIISLEPSVAILQLGANLFLAQHYIGVDQCYSVPVAEAENFAETVKTLKGAEPSLQTAYLLTNSLVDDAIKDKLKETLPVQQLADLASEQAAMPSYVRQIIEAGAKTFAVAELMLPQFPIDLDYQAAPTAVADKAEEASALANNLVKPAVVGGGEVSSKSTSDKEPEPVAVAVESLEEEEEAEQSAAPVVKSGAKNHQTVSAEPVVVSAASATPITVSVKKEIEVETEVSLQAPVEQVTEVSKRPEIDFSQFANLALDPSVFEPDKASGAAPAATPAKDESRKEAVTVIKNQNDGSSVAKMIWIGFLSFVITIALGAGLGFLYMQFMSQPDTAQPLVEVETEPTPEPTPTPLPLPEIDKAAQKLLVVNATTKAGYAGTVAARVKAAEFTQVTAQNAKGIYEPGDFLLVKEDTATAQALLKELNQATQLEMTLVVGMDKEDTSNAYSAILVLNQ